MRAGISHIGNFQAKTSNSLWNQILTLAIMTMTEREIGRCWKDVGERRWEPVSLGINLATGSTNRLSPPMSRQRTDSHLYCQVAAAAAPQKRGDSSKKLRQIGTPVKQNARQQDAFGGLATSEDFTGSGFGLGQLHYRFMQQFRYNNIQPEATMNTTCSIQHVRAGINLSNNGLVDWQLVVDLTKTRNF